jgi:hypothetical protein
MPIDPQEIVAQALSDAYGFPLQSRQRVESGSSFDDLMLKYDARSIRDAGPLNRVLTHYLAPGDVRGNRLLLLEDAPSRYQVFAYVKALRRVRRLNFRRADPIKGSGLFFEDAVSQRIEDFELKLLAESTLREIPVAQIELRPRLESAYERIVGTFVVPAPALVAAQFFREGHKIKELLVDLDSVREVEGRRYAEQQSILGPGNTITVVTTTEFEPLDEVPEQFFSVGNLERFSRLTRLDSD